MNQINEWLKKKRMRDYIKKRKREFKHLLVSGQYKLNQPTEQPVDF